MEAISRRALLTRVASTRAAEERDPGGTWLRVHRRAMACRVEIVLPGEDGRFVSDARAALDEADRLEDILSVFRETSDLARVNRDAAFAPVNVPHELFDVLRRSIEIHYATEGAFDISATPLSRCWGFLRREGRLPLPSEIEAARSSVAMDAIQLDEYAQSVLYRRPDLELNLGAIGKGYVLDRMAGVLRRAGIGEALISAGRSSLVAVGGAGRGWHVDLRALVGDEVLGRVFLRDAALGTSGAGEQYFEVDGVRYGHVIDPRTGWPASGIRSASVVARTAADADALSTAFLVGGVELARHYCTAHTDVVAVITPSDGRPRVFGAYRGVTLEMA